MFNSTKQSGSALLYALLVMSGAVAASFAVGTVVMNELRQSRNLDQSIIAYHAGMSAIEQAIYAARYDSSLINTIYTGYDSETNQGIANKVACHLTFSLGTSPTCETYYELATGQTFTLDPGKVRQINLFNDDLASGFGVESFVIDWHDVTITNTLEPWLEVEIFELNRDWTHAADLGPRDNYTLVRTCNYSGGTGYETGDPLTNAVNDCDQWIQNTNISSGQNYIIRMRPLYDTVSITFTAYDTDGGTGNAIAETSRYFYATGSFGSAQQALRAELPVDGFAPPFSDFVLFSECELAHGYGVSSNCP